jgi:tetratricopeptide (TPR) repeat protein
VAPPHGSRPLPISQLPAGPLHFSGRTAEFGELQASAEEVASTRTVVVSSIGGAGKTALVVQWAHQAVDRFPDGQLYVNLQGFTPGQAPVDPMDGLARFLRALGTPTDRLPGTLDERSALFRSTLAGQRMLVVLDNAATVEQVRPLLPGSTSCMTVVTSRDRLAGLLAREGAKSVVLDVLPEAICHQLLERMVGADRIAAEPEACGRIIELCGRLPLALRVVGANLALAGHRRLSDLAQELDHADRLDRLALPGDPATSVLPAFEVSYQPLPARLRLLFGRLGLLPGPAFSTSVVASMMAWDLPTTRTSLDLLTTLNLVTQSEHHRFEVHDLLRLFALRCAKSDPDLAAAERRLLDHYLQTAESANICLRPRRIRPAVDPPVDGVLPDRFELTEEALRWCEDELSNIAVLTEQAADGEHARYAMLLPTSLIDYFMHRKQWPVWLATHRTALAVARKLGDQAREGTILRDLGLAHRDLGELDEARMLCLEATRIARKCGDQMLLARADSTLGILAMDADDNEAATTYFAEAIELAHANRDRHGEMLSVLNLGFAYLRLEKDDEALNWLQRSLTMSRLQGARDVEAASLGATADLLHRRGDAELSLAQFRAVAALQDEDQNTYARIETHRAIATVLADLDRPGEAKTELQTAIKLARELGDPRADLLTAQLAELDS